MKYDTAIPIYLQVIDSLKKKLVTGSINPGDKLPSTRALAVEYNINPNTAARVYKEMEMKGICYTKRGSGTFVVEDPKIITRMRKDMAKKLIDGFTKEMTELGYDIDDMIKHVKLKGDEKDDSFKN